LVWVAFGLLFLLHQDFWWWDDRTLVLGYLPIGMFYHILFSIAAAVLWICATRWAWPEHLEEWATASERLPFVPVNPVASPTAERPPQ
jgi:hypothetical protein